MGLFDYFIIILDILIILLLFFFFLFNRGYDVNDRLNFVLTEINKITTQMIGWNSLKTEEKNTESKWSKNESIQNKNAPLRVHRMNWKLRIWELTDWESKNERRTMKNFHGIAHENVSEALWKHLGLEFFPSFSSPH